MKMQKQKTGDPKGAGLRGQPVLPVKKFRFPMKMKKEMPK